VHPVDVAILTAFIAWAVAAGLRSRKVAGRNLEEYFLAGRTLPGWKAGLSMAATQFSADTPLLVTGLIATGGVFALWRLWIYALAFLLMAFVLAPSWRRVRVLTDAELTEVRYGERAAAVLRGVKAIYFGTVFNCAVLAMVLLAATRIAEPFLTWHAWLPASVHGAVIALVEVIGVPLTVAAEDPSLWPSDIWVRSADNLLAIGAIVLVTTFYSTTGGLRSVVATDVGQFAIMIVATAGFVWVALSEVGGLGALPGRLEALLGADAPSLVAFTPGEAREVSLVFVALLGIQWIAQMNADGTGYLAQRSMACRTERDAQQAGVVFALVQILLRSLLWVPLGLSLLVVFPPDPSMAPELLRAEREATYVRGISELLPLGLRGLMLTAMLAALASTVDTHLNWGASYWTNDLYRRFVCGAWLKREPSDRSLVWVARGSNLVILAIALVVMGHLRSIQSAWYASLLLGAGMGVLLVLRWVWWRITATGELAAIVTSMVLAPFLLVFVPAEQEALRLIVMAAGCTFAGVAASLLFGPEPMARLVEFQRRARPPGFWGPVSRAAGEPAHESVRRLATSGAATLLATFSVFCVLVALGSLVAGSPAPAWFPHRGAWIASLLVVGVGLVPVWWRLGFRER
jgi:solute:Na+ symporter, SSS family